jgi:hypothetical protein
MGDQKISRNGTAAIVAEAKKRRLNDAWQTFGMLGMEDDMQLFQIGATVYLVNRSDYQLSTG